LLDAILLLKIGLAPLLILVASFAGNRWGNTISGWIVGLPLTSAPVILLLALEQGSGFAAASAQGALLGLVSLSAFSLAYSLLSLYLKLGWLPSMLLGWGIYFVSSIILDYASASLLVSFIIVLAWLLIVARVFPVVNIPEKTTSGGSTCSDVIIRIVGAIALIFTITEYAPTLGATLSGLLTPFPIYTSVMVSTIHRRQGITSASQFLRGATLSLFTPAVFWLMVGSTIVSWGVGASYIIAIVASLILHWALLKAMTKSLAT
jgi:hypothetical protein